MSVLAMQKPLTGKKVLTILLSVFAVVFAVNAFMIYSAVSTFSGVQRGASYRIGLHYNNTLGEQQAQDELHWSHQAQFSPDARVAVTFTDASGSPVAGLAIEGWLERPSSSSADRKLTFNEVGPGKYEAASASAEAGAWVLSFAAQKPRPGTTPALYRVKERLWIGPGAYRAKEKHEFGAAH